MYDIKTPFRLVMGLETKMSNFGISLLGLDGGRGTARQCSSIELYKTLECSIRMSILDTHPNFVYLAVILVYHLTSLDKCSKFY